MDSLDVDISNSSQSTSRPSGLQRDLHMRQLKHQFYSWVEQHLRHSTRVIQVMAIRETRLSPSSDTALHRQSSSVLPDQFFPSFDPPSQAQISVSVPLPSSAAAFFYCLLPLPPKQSVIQPPVGIRDQPKSCLASKPSVARPNPHSQDSQTWSYSHSARSWVDRCIRWTDAPSGGVLSSLPPCAAPLLAPSKSTCGLTVCMS